MVRKTYAAEQIINKLREAEVLLNQRATIGEACNKERLYGGAIYAYFIKEVE